MDGSKLLILLTVAVAVSAGIQSVARSEPSLQNAGPINAGPIVVTRDDARSRLDERPDFRSSHRASSVLLQAVLRQRRDDPEWLVRQVGVDPLDALDRADSRPRYVALQIDRLDGTDLLTVRQSLTTIHNLHVYAGAGLGRARYLDDDVLAKPLPRRRAHHSLGAAAEIGAQAQLGERISVVAALRWMKFGPDVTLLKSDYGTMNADAAMLGVTVGYRFR
jgi:hypothetical protein